VPALGGLTWNDIGLTGRVFEGALAPAAS